jgi:hypothetical protein
MTTEQLSTVEPWTKAPPTPLTLKIAVKDYLAFLGNHKNKLGDNPIFLEIKQRIIFRAIELVSQSKDQEARV